MGGALMIARNAWHESARECLAAAKRLTNRYSRSQANRVYYALFAETHAWLLRKGLQPRLVLGTWRHDDLPELVQQHLARDLGSVAARQWSRLLRETRALREFADYRPNVAVAAVDVRVLLQRVEHLIENGK